MAANRKMKVSGQTGFLDRVKCDHIPLIMSQILAHFQQHDPTLASLFTQHGLELPTLKPAATPDEYFHRLTDDIISQQLAGKAAAAIVERFYQLFPKQVATPQAVLALEGQAIRDIGASWAKVRSLQDLAAHVEAGKLNFAQFPEMSDEAIKTELVQVKGIGPWTAEMFLIFTLGRPDIFSLGDLGLKKGFQKLYQVTDQELASKLQYHSQLWSPYRSTAALALWRFLDNR